jgi:hypothetical protein
MNNAHLFNKALRMLVEGIDYTNDYCDPSAMNNEELFKTVQDVARRLRDVMSRKGVMSDEYSDLDDYFDILEDETKSRPDYKEYVDERNKTPAQLAGLSHSEYIMKQERDAKERRELEKRTTTGNVPIKRSGSGWLNKALDTISNYVESEDVILTKEVLPDIFYEKGASSGGIPYMALKSSNPSTDDLIMLMSPRHKEGLYVVKSEIKLPDGEVLPWNDAIDSYVGERDFRGRRDVGLLDFRDFLRETGQGVFFRRDMHDFEDLLIGLHNDNINDYRRMLPKETAGNPALEFRILNALRNNLITEYHYLALDLL